MQISAKGSVLSILVSSTEAYFFDRSGRCFSAWDEGWFISNGLSGRSVARRWSPAASEEAGRRAIRALTPEQIDTLQKKAQSTLAIAARENVAADVKRTLQRGLAFDKTRDIADFNFIYRPVGILPPDQYNACVIQITEGCGWDQCRFCSFYRRQPYHIKDLAEIQAHLRRVADYFGEGLSLRRSIFFGEANALAAPLEVLRGAMEQSRIELVPKMPHFRGFFSFNEVLESSCRSAADFRTLGAAGLRRVYYGLETGDADLRVALGKPGDLAALRESIQNAKSAGVLVALILLAGAGGRRRAKTHVQESIRFISRLPLDDADLIFLSPLYGPDGTREPPLSSDEMQSQVVELRAALSGKARVAPYDIREFVY